jgi:hypothetical protein
MDSITQSHPRAGKIAATKQEANILRQHLQEIIEGTAFRGSHRSGQFLKHIVEQAIAGNFDSLKERAIGIELFGRSPSYDTSEDAIVRVTASDVRKRLLQHYGKYGTASEIRLSLPSGSYIPEVHRDSQPIGPLATPVVAPSEPILASATDQALAETPQLALHPQTVGSLHISKWVVFGVLLAALNLAAWVVFWNHSSRIAPRSSSILPWSGLFRSSGSTKVITSDSNIEKIERLSGEPVSLSDYANQQYIPNPSALPPEILRFCKDFLRGDLAPTVDLGVVARIAALAQTSSSKIDVRGAREIRLSDVYTDEDFIFLGSPRSNRWASLFNDQLDFQFVLDNQREIIRNVHPRPTEKPFYVPTAGGYATGQSFATISFIGNPGRSGQVLLLAGANAEGTAATGELVADRQRLSSELKSCGISPSGPIRHFQLLLALNTMAGSPSDVKVIACHVLPGNPGQ